MRAANAAAAAPTTGVLAAGADAVDFDVLGHPRDPNPLVSLPKARKGSWFNDISSDATPTHGRGGR
ncbi:PE domain-containing protein [Mycobacterium simulans]|uniref:PE domain-containing protein n=1 Tax=Mycobacterium simulans TaxID=627089 RepID=UPI001C92104D|nr:PE domain-containing protein [Mycobacterium simulans]